MTIGTKSVLYGAHCFAYHWLAVAAGWWQLYRWAPAIEGGRWPGILDPRLWFVFFVHDLGYVGRPNMDGREGELHPYPVAFVASCLFDNPRRQRPVRAYLSEPEQKFGPWGLLVLLHSRHLAKALGEAPSKLCAADKLAISLTPWWLYLPGTSLTGELDEYFEQARSETGQRAGISTESRRAWFASVGDYCRAWALEHAHAARDEWTRARDHGGSA